MTYQQAAKITQALNGVIQSLKHLPDTTVKKNLEIAYQQSMQFLKDAIKCPQ